MFEHPIQQVKLSNVNARSEKHGNEHKTVYDVAIIGAFPNSSLNMFDRELRDFLYKVPSSPDLIEAEEPEQLTEPRFPLLKSLKFEKAWKGYAVTFGYGIGGDSDIVCEDCTIDKFSFSPQNGGTVIIGYRIIVSTIKPEHVGLLCEKIQQDVELTVAAPEPTTVHELFGEESVAA